VLSKIFIRKRVEMTECITRNLALCPTDQITLG
jgi:hypothetical protein